MPGRYTTIEKVLLVVFTLMAIGAPIVFVLKTAERMRQYRSVKVTMADIRIIASAWEARADDLKRYNAAGSAITFTRLGETSPTVLRHSMTVDQLAGLLAPKYVPSFPMRDGWGHEWRFATDRPFPDNGASPAQNYVIASPGRDGTFEPMVNGNQPCAAWECDIVFSNGVFITKFRPSDSSPIGD